MSVGAEEAIDEAIGFLHTEEAMLLAILLAVQTETIYFSSFSKIVLMILPIIDRTSLS
jgi:hypothetical protein